MTRFILLCFFASSLLLASSLARAERITVGSETGDDLINACARMPDMRIIATNKGNYNGCCSKALGYCILCPSVGKCYKFSNAKSLNEFKKDIAPNGNLIINEKPVRPLGVIKKTAPNNRKVVE